MSGATSGPDAAAPDPPPPGPTGLRVLPVSGIGPVRPGDDLAALIVTAAPWLRSGDVLVVTSKIVSKAEGRLVDLPPGEPERTAAREELVAAESARVVARRGPTTIVQTHHGFVMAAAGIDASNVDRDQLVLLPKDPDDSARALRSRLRETHGLDVAVVVSDTMGRPWRNGLTDVALGAAGIEPIRDHRGQLDPYGNDLQLTQTAVVDELAAAADLVKGKVDGVPVAVVRGLRHPAPAAGTDGPGATALVRDGATDMFSLGTAEARAAGRHDVAVLTDTDALPGAPVDPAALRQAVSTVAGVVAAGTELTTYPDRSGDRPDVPVTGAVAVVRCRPPATAPAALVRFGADVHRFRAALAAQGLRSAVVADPADPTGLLVAVSGPG